MWLCRFHNPRFEANNLKSIIVVAYNGKTSIAPMVFFIVVKITSPSNEADVFEATILKSIVVVPYNGKTSIAPMVFLQL